MAHYSVAVVAAVVAVLFSAVTVHSQAPAPEAPGPLNFTAILEKGGQFSRFIRLAAETQVDDQIANQLNNSRDGLTVFAPTDNAFDNLKPGLLNGLSEQEQGDLLRYHIIPKFYTLNDLVTVSNPVRTQYAQDGLNFTGLSQQQVNVSTGLVETRVSNTLRKDSPLAIYVIDVALLPRSLFTAKPPSSAPPPPVRSAATNSSSSNNDSPSPSSHNNAATTSSAAAASALLLLVSLIASMLS